MIGLPSSALEECFGIGVAGNFAGHLEQAGEAADFVDVAAAPEAPKGIFPFYLPGDAGFLGQFPLSGYALTLPRTDQPLNLQIEPEAGVLCEISYEGGVPAALTPRALGAFNDCSIRRPGAKKISEKKNWGVNSKGFAPHVFQLEEIDAAGATSSFRLASFLRRDGEVFEYGVDSPLSGYSYYGAKLLDWVVDRLRNQTGEADSPLEPVGEYLAACGSPPLVLIGIGATRYTEFGESNFLAAGDESIVIVYDSTENSSASVHAAVVHGTETALADASVLVQLVEAA